MKFPITYLDKTGLITLVNELKSIFQPKGNYALDSEVNELSEALANSPSVAYGTCTTEGATADKVVTISDENWKLLAGCVVFVYFANSNSASNVRLNVNGTGAYPIWYNNAEYTSTGTQYTGYAKRVINYMFNGTHWVYVGSSYDSNTTYKNVTLGQGYATCSTAKATLAKVGTLSGYTLTVGGIVAVKFTYEVPKDATLNINSKGAKKIFYRGSAIVNDIIQAGDIAAFIYDGTQYQLLAIDRSQDVNAFVSHTTFTTAIAQCAKKDDYETWTFTLENGVTVTKKVIINTDVDEPV